MSVIIFETSISMSVNIGHAFMIRLDGRLKFLILYLKVSHRLFQKE